MGKYISGLKAGGMLLKNYEDRLHECLQLAKAGIEECFYKFYT